jgi:hypothetical protein
MMRSITLTYSLSAAAAEGIISSMSEEHCDRSELTI